MEYAKTMKINNLQATGMNVTNLILNKRSHIHTINRYRDTNSIYIKLKMGKTTLW